MKNICRYVFWSLFVILVLSPGSSDAGFLVELHNGRRLTVEGYRIDGKSYELYLQSGYCYWARCPAKHGHLASLTSSFTYLPGPERVQANGACIECTS